MKVTPILGIDIAKLKFDVFLRWVDRPGQKARFDNNKKGFKQLQNWLLKHKVSVVHACLESTSWYGDALATYLFHQKHLVSMINPRRGRNYANRRLVRTQNDRIDAELLADFCAKESPRLWQPAPDYQRQLKDLTRLREFFASQLRPAKGRLEHNNPVILAQMREHIENLKSSVIKTNKQIADLIQATPELAKQVKLLRTIRGIGPVVSAVCVAELPPVAQLRSASSAVAYAGVDPKNKTSGKTISTKPRLSKMGPSLLRQALYMAALTASRRNPIIKDQHRRLATKGKTGKLAIGAAMRKLMRLIYGVLKHQMPF